MGEKHANRSQSKREICFEQSHEVHELIDVIGTEMDKERNLAEMQDRILKGSCCQQLPFNILSCISVLL